MKKVVVLALGLFLSGCQSSIQQAPGFTDAFPPVEWSKSGGGSDIKYVCKTESCGGTKTEVSFTSIRNFGLAPDLGITGGKKLEEEFRNRPSVRTTLVSMLKRALRSDDPNATIDMSYFTTSNYVGYRISGYSPKWGTHVLGEVRIDNNTIILILTESENTGRLRPLLSKLMQNLVIKNQS